METRIIKIDEELSNQLRGIQLELEGLKSMLGFCYSTTDYVIPEDRITKIEEDLIKKEGEYSTLKTKVNKLVINEVGHDRCSWNLDFDTHEATVTIND